MGALTQQPETYQCDADAIPRRRTNKSFLTLLVCLDAADDKLPLAMILDAASSAVRKAEQVAEETNDELTAIDARGSRGLLMRTLQQAASKGQTRALQQGSDNGHRNLETMAANTLELAIKALRHGLEIEAGLCQRLTAPQLHGRAAVDEDLTRLGEADRRRAEASIAAWLALPAWEVPGGRDNDQRVVQVDMQLEQLLDRIRVPTQVRRWLDARRMSKEA